VQTVAIDDNDVDLDSGGILGNKPTKPLEWANQIARKTRLSI